MGKSSKKPGLDLHAMGQRIRELRGFYGLAMGECEMSRKWIGELQLDQQRLIRVGALLPKILETLPWSAYKGALMEDGDIKAAIDAARSAVHSVEDSK